MPSANRVIRELGSVFRYCHENFNKADHEGQNKLTDMNIAAKHAVALLEQLKEKDEIIDKLYKTLDEVCKDVRETYGNDDVCGLCQYDGAYKGYSGDWMNECPGFDSDECFCMSNKIRKMCGKELIPEREWQNDEI